MARVTPAKRATRASTKKPAGGHEDWMDDEVDEHHRSRDKISLDPDASSSEDDEDDEDVAGVMDIAAEDDSEDETSDDDETDDEEDEGEEEEGKKNTATDPGDSDGDEEEAALIRAMRAQQRRLDAKGATRRTADDDDLEDSETDSDDETAGIRGSKKDDFYGDDDVDHEGLSDEDDRIDEEREARRLQRAAADGMQGGDFDAFSDSESESEEEKTMGAKAKLVANKGKKGAAKKTKASTKKSEGAFVESLGAEAVAHAASDAVVGDAPELIALTKELTKNLDEVRNSVEPVIAAARAGDLVTAEGISYLDAKHLLMLSYCVNIVFYLLLKSEGRPVKDHPVVLRLVEIRAYLEKLRPIDRKLKYQVDKLLKMAEGKQQNTNDGSDEDDDPTKHKPNPDALVGAGGDDGDDKSGAYRPPKLFATTMDEFEEGGKSNKQKRNEKEARRRASRSALIKELAQELGETPEELGGDVGDTSSAFAKREFARMEARAKIEEDLFTRVPLSKTERRRAKATSRSMNSLANVGDFGDDVADLVEVAEALEKSGGAAAGKRAGRLVDSVSLASGVEVKQKQKPVSGEQDVPQRDSLGDRRNKYERGVNKAHAAAARAAEAEAGGMYDDDAPRQSIPDDDEYVAASAARDAKRNAKEEKYRRSLGVAVAMEEEIDGDEKRDVGGKIMANRGLTPHRNKEHKNPRKRLRGKFEKAVVRRKGQVRTMREDGGGYAGEQSGIKTSVTKSRKFGA